MENPVSDTNWREELKAYTSSKYQLELLENGPRSLSQSYVMGYLYQKWKKINGIAPDKDSPNCQSSFLEWSKKSINKVGDD